jgi:hypothetical protein
MLAKITCRRNEPEGESELGLAAQHQIDATDKQIDQLVYELYGLTDKEIRIVEESTKRKLAPEACSIS